MSKTLDFDAKISFQMEEQEFMGQLSITLSSGTIWTPGYFEFFGVLSAHFWLKLPIEECIAKWRANQPQLVQDSHRKYMEHKYPGWPHLYLEPKHRPQAGAEKIDASHLNAEDLDL